MILCIKATYRPPVFGNIRNFSSLMTRIAYMINIKNKISPKTQKQLDCPIKVRS